MGPTAYLGYLQRRTKSFPLPGPNNDSSVFPLKAQSLYEIRCPKLQVRKFLIIPKLKKIKVRRTQHIFSVSTQACHCEYKFLFTFSIGGLKKVTTCTYLKAIHPRCVSDTNKYKQLAIVTHNFIFSVGTNTEKT
jgi:hypothetical protein